jgi:hypothetical protein
MLLLEGYISNFTCAGYSFLYVEFSDFYVNQSLAGQTTYISLRHILCLLHTNCHDVKWWTRA